VGSDFQKRVWESLLEIPYGKTLSYSRLSRRLGDEKAIRAVARANGDNALSIIVPCHRILGSDGGLVGYAGGLRAKQKLLQLENASLQQELNFDS
jgi:methylated-DNA-[protein]-cysteine S-methyltransferase